MSQASDVVIIGGGVIGLTTAYFLAKQGAAVEVIDKGELGAEASWAGAGIIPPGKFSTTLSPIDQLRALSVTAFPAFAQELQEITGIDTGYRICGGIEFFEDGDAQVDAWKREGIAFERVPSGQITRFEPNCEPVPGESFFFEAMAQTRNPWHLRALIAACRSTKVQLRPGAMLENINLCGNKVADIRLSSGEKRVADRYLLATGAWTNPLLAPFHRDPGIHPVRGQIVLLRTSELILKRIVLVGKNYLVPREDGRLLIGATEEPEAGFIKQNTAMGVTSLLEFATSLVPRLKDAEVEKCWSGIRPGSPDGMPFLGAIPGFDNAFVASGHFRAGIQLSLGTAKVMSEVILGKKPTIPLEFFSLDRKPDTLTVPAFRS